MHLPLRRQLLMQAAKTYHEMLPGSPAEKLLEERGLPLKLVEKFKLGYVAQPLEGHEYYRDCLVIPYFRKSATDHWQVIEMKFRPVTPRPGVDKYLNITGSQTRLFNTLDMLVSEKVISICEGELDTIAASANGIPAVGVPGVTNWKPHYNALFQGFEAVYLLGDGDPKGQLFNTERAREMPNSKIIRIPDGLDVNSLILSEGVDWLKEKMK